jgi:hypothetical protein
VEGRLDKGGFDPAFIRLRTRIFISRHQNPGRNYNTKPGVRFFENMAQFNYSGTISTSQKFIHQGLKRRMFSYHSVQSFSFLLPSKAVKIKTIMLRVFCMGMKLGLWHLNVDLLTIFVIWIFVYSFSIIDTSSVVSSLIIVALFMCFLNNFIFPLF